MPAEKSEKIEKKPKNTETQDSYAAKDIYVLEGLEPVRKRPGMYIGSTGVDGLHHLIWEIVDNSIDEALAGFARNIKVEILPGNEVAVTDDDLLPCSGLDSPGRFAILPNVPRLAGAIGGAPPAHVGRVVLDQVTPRPPRRENEARLVHGSGKRDHDVELTLG